VFVNLIYNVTKLATFYFYVFYHDVRVKVEGIGMKISAINAFTNHMPQNAGQRVSFGIFGDLEDVRTARLGRTPEHKPALEGFMKQEIEFLHRKGRRMKEFSEKPGQPPITYFEMFKRSPHFLFYRREDDKIGVEVIKKAFEGETKEAKARLRAKQKIGSPVLQSLQTSLSLANMVSFVHKLQYGKYFPPTRSMESDVFRRATTRALKAHKLRQMGQ